MCCQNDEYTLLITMFSTLGWLTLFYKGQPSLYDHVPSDASQNNPRIEYYCV